MYFQNNFQIIIFYKHIIYLQGDLLKRKYKDLKQQWQEKIDILNTVEK